MGMANAYLLEKTKRITKKPERPAGFTYLLVVGVLQENGGREDGHVPGLGLPSEGPWLCVGKNSRVGCSKVKAGLFREIHAP